MVRRLSRGATAVNTRPAAYERYTDWIDRMTGTRLTAQKHCHNYYYSPTGRNVTQFPMTQTVYALCTRLLPIVGVKTIR
jgi:secreted trypsin-like serine protease